MCPPHSLPPPPRVPCADPGMTLWPAHLGGLGVGRWGQGVAQVRHLEVGMRHSHRLWAPPTVHSPQHPAPTSRVPAAPSLLVLLPQEGGSSR